MTILEWLKASTRYTFEDTTFQAIAIDREINDTAQDVTTLSIRDKELLTADIIFVAIVLSPSNTASKTSSHNNFELQVGSEISSTEKRNFDISMMTSIYKKYEDPKYDLVNGSKQTIKIIPIEDII